METISKTSSAEAYTTSYMADVFARQQKHKSVLSTTTAKERIQKLKKLKQLIIDNQEDIKTALYADFRKPGVEAELTEIMPVIKSIDFAVKHLSRWMKPRRVSTPLTLAGTRSWVHPEPKGVSLIIAPWNYPFMLLFDPLVSAMSAGNTVILKPSEVTPATAALATRLIGKNFPDEEITVIEGDKDVSTQLLALPFDHIFFTGSPEIGKVVMQAAAKNLTSVTLELGGKSPVVVDESADLADAARKIVFGKFTNCGQTCIAPDYILVHESVKKALLGEMTQVIEKFYGAHHNQENSESYARIVNGRHFGRLHSLLNDATQKGAQIVSGGRSDASQCFIAPTLLTGITDDMQIMQEEIFGPLLPVRPYTQLSEAIEYINGKEKPLALYMFSKNDQNINTITSQTSAGGSSINDTLMHIMNPNLPFGGVNNSGIGKSHGYYGFKEFTNEKAVLRQRAGFTMAKMLYPPYTATSRKLVGWLQKYF
jgi:aldehyde dehydrogenase (NAD+)